MTKALLFASKLMLLCIHLFLFCSCSSKVQDVTITVPSNFEGTVILIFDQPDGVNPEIVSGNNLNLEIPKSGILKVKLKSFKAKFKLNIFYDFEGMKISIPIMDSQNFNEFKAEEKVAFNPSIGGRVEKYNKEKELILIQPTTFSIVIGKAIEVYNIDDSLGDVLKAIEGINMLH